MRCPKGTILRKAYSKKKGTKVKKACIKATSQTGEKTSIKKNKLMRKMARTHKKAIEKFGEPICSEGQIMREGYHRKSTSRKAYTRKNGTKIKRSSVKGAWVAPGCVKAKGLSVKRGQKGLPLIGPMVKGELKRYGYMNVKNLPEDKRHEILQNALSELKPLPLSRKLIALSTLNKNVNKKLSKIFKADANWIKTTKEYSNR